MFKGMLLAGIGLAIGLGAAYGISRLLARLLPIADRLPEISGFGQMIGKQFGLRCCNVHELGA